MLPIRATTLSPLVQYNHCYKILEQNTTVTVNKTQLQNVLTQRSLPTLYTQEFEASLSSAQPSLYSIMVQCRCLDIITLKQKSNAWPKIVFSLLAAQVTLMIPAGVACSPAQATFAGGGCSFDPSHFTRKQSSPFKPFFQHRIDC